MTVAKYKKDVREYLDDHGVTERPLEKINFCLALLAEEELPPWMPLIGDEDGNDLLVWGEIAGALFDAREAINGT